MEAMFAQCLSDSRILNFIDKRKAWSSSGLLGIPVTQVLFGKTWEGSHYFDLIGKCYLPGVSLYSWYYILEFW